MARKDGRVTDQHIQVELTDDELAAVIGGTEGPGGPTDGTSAR